VALIVDHAERPQRLLRTTQLLRVREAFVLLDLRKSLLVFEAKLNIVECLIRETNQVGSDGERELPERDFAVRMVAQSTKNRVDIFFQNFLLELKQVRFYVFEVQEAKVSRVYHAEH